MIWNTELIMVAPPGDPYAANGLPCLRRIVGDMLLRGRLKGATSLALVFDSMELGGRRVPIAGRVVQTSASHPSQERRVARDGAIGGLAGLLVGGPVGLVLGAVVGGGASAAAAAHDQDPRLSRGTRIAIRMTRPIESLSSVRHRDQVEEP